MTRTQPNEPEAQEWPAAKKALWKVVTGENLNDGHYINAYRLTEKLYAALAAAPIVPAPAYGVKALEWTNIGRCVGWNGEDEHTHLYHAKSLDRLYEVARGKVGWWAKWQGAFHAQELPTLDEAKAAAQADFERRVLSCLSSAPVEEADAKAGEPQRTFGLSADDVETLRANGLKPEEISGDQKTQAERVGELLRWFVRLSRDSANPKWSRAHAYELAYYIATTDDRAPFDVAEIERKAWLQGLSEPVDTRDMAIRHGWIAAPPASTIPSEPEAKEEAGAGPVGEAVACKRVEGWQPIETAPTGGKFGCFLTLAFGPPGDQTVSEGMHFQGRFYAASVFYTGGPHDTKQFTFREHEVKPTHWRPTPAAPGVSRPVEEPGEVERITRELRRIVSHATAGRTDGAGMSVNDVSVAITALRNELWQEARKKPEAALAETRERLEKRAGAAEARFNAARGLIRDAIGLVPLAHQNWHADARAALSTQESSAALAGDGKEAGR